MIEEAELNSTISKMSNFEDKLEKLRTWRGRKDRDLTLKRDLIALQRSLKKTNNQLSQIYELWESVVPEKIKANAHPISLQRGVLEIAANGSPTSYQLQRLIREGLLQALQSQCTTHLKKIKITLVS